MLIFALLAAGCTTSRPGSAHSVDETSTPLSAAAGPVPKVPAPLDVAPLRRDPCALLAPAQLRTVGLAAPKPNVRQSPVLVGCDWADDGVGLAGVRVAVGLQIAPPGGLAGIYRQRHAMAYWQPVTIDGYPGVLADRVDGRATGDCRMSLAGSDTDVLLLTYDADPGSRPCDRLRVLADAVVRALRASTR